MTDKNHLYLSIADDIVSRFNALTNETLDFEQICEILDKFTKHFVVYKNKEHPNYNKHKKRFVHLLTYNFNFIQKYFSINNTEQFRDGPNESWALLHYIIICYFNYLDHVNFTDDINYKGMVSKLWAEMNKSIKQDEEQLQLALSWNASGANASGEDKPENKPSVIKGLFNDVKNMLFDDFDPSTINDKTRALANKYQGMLSNGSLKMNNLLDDFMDIVQNPEMINEEFKNIDEKTLPNLDSLMKTMLNDSGNNPFGSIMSDVLNGSSGLAGNPLGSLLSGDSGIGSLMSGLKDILGEQVDDGAPKTVNELQSEIERMLLEMEEEDQEDQEEDQEEEDQEENKE